MATTQLAAGRSPLDVQRQMGHRNLTMTNKYASLTVQHLKEPKETKRFIVTALLSEGNSLLSEDSLLFLQGGPYVRFARIQQVLILATSFGTMPLLQG